MERKVLTDGIYKVTVHNYGSILEFRLYVDDEPISIEEGTIESLCFAKDMGMSPRETAEMDSHNMFIQDVPNSIINGIYELLLDYYEVNWDRV